MMLPRNRMAPRPWSMSQAKEIGLSAAAVGIAIRLFIGPDSQFIPYYVSLIVGGLLCPWLVKLRNRIAVGSGNSRV